MSCVFIVMTLVSLRMPAAQTFQATDWKPTFTDPADISISCSTLALLTHSSRLFDPLGVTRPAVCRTVSKMKAAALPVLYLHDQYNSKNPAWMYLYDDWQPTAFVGSDIGHIKLNLSQVEHVICLGGFFGQCERATVSDVVRLWHADGLCHDLRLTQVVDGTFTVAQHLKWEDRFRASIREFLKTELKSRHSAAVLTVDQMLQRIESFDDAAEFLQRQLPAVPDDVNVVIDVFGETLTLQAVGSDVPTLTFSYRRSNSFLEYDQPTVNDDAPRQWVRTFSRKPYRAFSGFSSPRFFFDETSVYGTPVHSPLGRPLPSGVIISNEVIISK